MQCGISWMNKKIVLRFEFKVSNKVMMQSFYYLKRGNNIFFFHLKLRFSRETSLENEGNDGNDNFDWMFLRA